MKNMRTIQSINHSEIDSIKTLLRSVNLPDSDLDIASVYFFGVKEDQRLIATGALEIYGAYAIVRSLAVQQAYQNHGYGKQIVRFLEKKAVGKRIKKLFLLTTTTEKFFSKLKYLPIQRDLCPGEILSSAQFRDICPHSATCLFKNMDA